MFKKMMLFVAMFLVSSMLWSQKRITVEAKSYDVSDNLDLEAIAIAFGKANNLEEFEKMINDPQNPISNLDLNRDGYVDFLRVVEVLERGEHLILLQAVLERDVYQDVATIIVEGNNVNTTKVTIIGDEYIYGRNYIIQPIYVVRPPLFTYFWTPYYRVYCSTFYWNYYPSWYYHYYCMGHHTYHRYMHDWHSHHHHHCDFHRPHDYHHDFHSYNTYNSYRRNDYGDRYPERGNRTYADNHKNPNNPNVTNPNVGNENGRRQPGSLSTSPNNRNVNNNIPRSVSMTEGERPVVNRPSNNGNGERRVNGNTVNANRNMNSSTTNSVDRNSGTTVRGNNSNANNSTSSTLPARPVNGREVNTSSSTNRSSSTTVSRPSSSSNRSSSTTASRPSSSSNRSSSTASRNNTATRR